jgi:hypothetical protein
MRFRRGPCFDLIERSPTECGVTNCDRETLIMRKPWPTRCSCAMGIKIDASDSIREVSQFEYPPGI